MDMEMNQESSKSCDLIRIFTWTSGLLCVLVITTMSTYFVMFACPKGYNNLTVSCENNDAPADNRTPRFICHERKQRIYVGSAGLLLATAQLIGDIATCCLAVKHPGKAQLVYTMSHFLLIIGWLASCTLTFQPRELLGGSSVYAFPNLYGKHEHRRLHVAAFSEFGFLAIYCLSTTCVLISSHFFNNPDGTFQLPRSTLVANKDQKAVLPMGAGSSLGMGQGQNIKHGSVKGNPSGEAVNSENSKTHVLSGILKSKSSTGLIK